MIIDEEGRGGAVTAPMESALLLAKQATLRQRAACVRAARAADAADACSAPA
jgi:hypothetical protein